MLWLMSNTSLMNQWKMIWEHKITFEKITSGQGDDYTTDCLLDYKLIAIDLSKQ